MSDKSFDDDLLEEYDTETGQVIDSKQKKKGSLTSGLAFGLIITVVLELGVGLALDVQGDLVHRYVAYMLGLLPIFVAAFMTRSILKMFFIGAPVLILASFGLPFLLPDIFSGLMTPFLSLLPIVIRLNEVFLELGTDTGIGDQIDLVKDYGIALDFALGIFVGLFAAIGLTGVVKLITQKPGILTIFTFIFSMVFLVIGVILLPYLLVVTSGLAQFGLSFSAGGALLGAGTAQATSPDGDLDLANQYFAEAKGWFQDAELTLQGLANLGLFGIIGGTNPNLKIIVDNGLALLTAGVELAQGVAPALAGFGSITQGMDLALDSFNTGSATALSLSQGSSDFDDGLELIERGFSNFTDSIASIKEAISTIEEDVNRDDLVAALTAQGAPNIDETLNFIFSGLPLLDVTLDVFSNTDGTGLIDDPDGVEDDTQRSPIVHLLLGAQSMTSVQSQIGGNSDFAGTGSLFADLIFHLQFVVDALDPTINLPMGELNNLVLDANAPEALVDLKNQITGTTSFLKDAGDITIAIGQFGIIASPTLFSMNSTMFFLTTADDFTTIPAADFDGGIEGFVGTPSSGGIIFNASQMQIAAAETAAVINTMKANSANESYGFFNGPASEFVIQFEKFDLPKNADNFFYISSALSALLKAMKVMTSVDAKLALVEGNVTVVQTEISTAQTALETVDVPGVQTAMANAETAVGNVKIGLVDANDTLEIAKTSLLNASINFNATRDMPQLAATGTALGRIGARMENIQVGNGTFGGLSQTTILINSIETSVGNIEAMASDGLTAQEISTDIPAEFANIELDLDDVELELQYMQDQFALIQTDLADVSVDA